MALIVVDGDTFKLPSGETIRISNIDTPESGGRAQCDAEKFLAIHARQALEEILCRSAPQIFCEPRPDKYGRTLARITVAGRDVGQEQIDRNLAYRWQARRHQWCRSSNPRAEPPNELPAGIPCSWLALALRTKAKDTDCLAQIWNGTLKRITSDNASEMKPGGRERSNMVRK